MLPEHEINKADGFSSYTDDTSEDLICGAWMSPFEGRDSSIPPQDGDKQKINSRAALIDDASTVWPLFFIK